MSRLKVDNIETRSGNNVSMDDPLRLKNYTTAQKNALTAVAGDIVYDTDEAAPFYYNGTTWKVMKDIPALTVEYLVIAGGGGGSYSGVRGGGAGGAGGYRNSYNNEASGRNSSSEDALNLVLVHPIQSLLVEVVHLFW